MNFRRLPAVQKFVLEHASMLLFLNLILAAIVVLFTRYHLEETEREKIQTRHEKLVQDFHLAFEQYVHPLEGILSTLHYSKLDVTAQNFRSAAESRNLFRNFSGALGFGFIRRVKSSELSAYEKRKRFQAKRLNEVAALSRTSGYSIIEVVEPIEKNRNAIGLIVSDDSVRADAMTQAMLTGKPQITRQTSLIESDQAALGFVYYLPIYKTALTPMSEDKKESELFGWAYSPILASEIIAFVKKQNPDAMPFQLLQLGPSQTEEVLFESEKYQNFLSRGLPFFQKQVLVNGQTWKISSVSTEHAYSDIEIKSILLGLLLAIGSLLFYYYSRLLQKRLQFDSQLILKSREDVKVATRELLEQKEFLQNLIDSLPAMVGYWDKQLNNKLSNKMYQDFFGYSPQMIFGKPTRELLPLSFSEKKSSSLGETSELETPFLNRAGETRILLTKYQPHKVNGILEGVTVVGIDVTDIRQLENKNRENEAMLFAKAKLSMLGEMACGIAHEINNPLAIILGKSDIMKRTIEGATGEFPGKTKILSDLSTVSRTAIRIAAIVKGLRSFARDSEDDPYQNADVKGIIDNVLSLVQERIKSKGIFFDYNTVRSDQILFCNRTQIEQVFMNLISNSIDAIAELSEKWIKIEVKSLNQQWHIRLSDSGLGIPIEVVEKMMNPFFTTKEVGHGTGLGLSISKRILERHHASLRYEPYQTHTSFVIIFPKSDVIENRC